MRPYAKIRIESERWRNLPVVNQLLGLLQDLKAEPVPDLERIARVEREIERLDGL